MLGRFDSVNDNELIGLAGKFGSDAIAELKARGFFKKGYPGVDRMDLVNVFKAHIDECFAAMVEIVDNGGSQGPGCEHDWTEESASNGWRSNCRLCGKQASGSGQ